MRAAPIAARRGIVHHRAMPQNPFPVELLTTAQMMRADRLTIDGGVPGMTLMEAAAAAIAKSTTLILQKTSARRVLVLCGPGNNGGDGYVAARILRSQRFKVRVAALAPPEALHGDALAAAKTWTGPVEPAENASFEGVDLVVDALFGTGLARDLEGPTADLVRRLNAWRRSSGQYVVAVDIPSGVDGTTGAIRGAAVEADETITFFRLKCGHLLLPGRLLCGRLTTAHIGIRSAVLDKIAVDTFVNEPALWRAALLLPQIENHKYARGHALIVSGGPEHTGAARLAATAALRGGAGLVTLASPSSALAINAGALTSVMVRASDGPAGLAALLADARINAVALGPALGVGEETRALVETALAASPAPRAVTLDADALTSFEADPARLWRAIKNAPGPVALTPHAGEFARLFQLRDARDAPPESKLEKARAAARASGATVLFKGPDTVVAAPDGRASVTTDTSPWLATAGSGDVLTGMVAALLAQGMEPLTAASCAAWMHRRAAEIFGPGLIADDIIATLPAVWRELSGAAR
jgi:ADP-dependent NAD(P)H-hydrate dehydratase / NAD(P)H-hydrate epimerase